MRDTPPEANQKFRSENDIFEGRLKQTTRRYGFNCQVKKLAIGIVAAALEIKERIENSALVCHLVDGGFDAAVV